METGRKTHEATVGAQENRLENNEKYVSNLQVDLDEELQAEKAHRAQDLHEELKVFKDCSIREFVDIFGTEPNPELPLFTNIWLLRERVRYDALLEGLSVQYALFATIGLNFFWYYAYLKKRYIGQTLRFCRFPRTIMIFGLYMAANKRLF